MKKRAILTLAVAIILLLSLCSDSKAAKNELLIFDTGPCGIVIASTQVNEDVFIIKVRFDERPENDEFFARKSPIELGAFVRVKHVYAGKIELIILEKCK